MLTTVGNTSMPLAVSEVSHHYPGIRFMSVLILLVWGVFTCAQVNAKAPPGHEYFVQEPVFGGHARIVEAGPANAPLVVLVHGLNESADDWYPFIPALAQHMHVLSFDLPGFGQSSKANKYYTPDNYVRFIRYLLRRYPAQKIILVGHSLGANIALRYAATYPQQVDRLMLVDAAGILHRLTFSRYLAHYGIRDLPSLYSGQRQDLQSLANGILGTLTQYATLDDIGESAILSDPTLRQDLLGGYPPAIAIHAMMMTEFKNILDNFSVPTFIVWGGHDRVTPIRTAKMLAADFENAGLVVIEQAGHNPLDDTPARFGHWLLRFAGANAAERDAILQQHRYAPPVETGTGVDRIGTCHYEQDKTFRGRYKRVVVDHCQGVRFQNFIADSVTVTDSKAEFENCRLHSHGKGLWLKNSEVVITACHILGSPAIELNNTKLDVAGSHIIAADVAIKEAAASQGSEILFSITRVISHQQSRLLHGPYSLSPGQQW